MIKLFEEQNIPLSQVQKELGLAHYTLYKYANKKISIDRMETGTFLSLCKIFNENPVVLYTKIKNYLEK